ncbi:hypothetical protein Hanom_Chr07g00623961 [Helianthus anomalus]
MVVVTSRQSFADGGRAKTMGIVEFGFGFRVSVQVQVFRVLVSGQLFLLRTGRFLFRSDGFHGFSVTGSGHGSGRIQLKRVFVSGYATRSGSSQLSRVSGQQQVSWSTINNGLNGVVRIGL